MILAAESPAAGADPPAPDSPSLGVPVSATGQRDAAAVPVTLVTGDVVTVSTLPNGHQSFGVVHTAPRSAGEVITVSGFERNGDLYVVPSDAEANLASGTLDRELFNVTALARTSGDAIPVILSYGNGDQGLAATSEAEATAALPGTTQTLDLPLINGVATEVNPARAGQFWHAIDADAPPGTEVAAAGRLDAPGVTKVWLDRPVTMSLDESVPQIGAPEAWEAGFDGTGITVAVLDTGIDDTHPDLAGKVTAARNFSRSPTAEDHVGHGTHVASTIAGTGAASDGRYKGVAPGASLLSAKVLDDTGHGTSSDIIAGLDWAADQGADVVNLSLSADQPSDANSPMSLAVDRITDQTGVLVVCAAGNKFATATVYAPAAATEALAVGAVTKSDQMANFSSRGPALTTAAVKPEITAPGVDIVAARADGTALGPIVDEDYVELDGTSMATPHVAGTAALLSQAKPDWDAPELKDAMVSTAKTGGFGIFDEGAGRVDVPRALNQGVYATATVNFGAFPFPWDGAEPVTKPVTYRNEASEPVTLNLDVTATGWSGDAASDGAIGLGADTVTVAPGGTATVDVIVDPTAGADGVYSGLITATTAKGAPVEASLRTPLSWYKEPRTGDLTVHVTDARGQGRSGGLLRVTAADDPDPNQPFDKRFRFVPVTNGVARVRLPEGSYMVHDIVNDTTLDMRRVTLLVDADVRVPEDTEVELDARDATPLNPSVDEHVMQWGTVFGETRFSAPSGTSLNEVTGVSPGRVQIYTSEAGDVSTGSYSQFDKWTLESSLLDVRVRGHHRLRLHPDYDPFLAAPKLAELNGTVPLVFVGAGTPEDLAGKDIRDKAVLVRIPAPAGDDDLARVNEAYRLAEEATDAVAAAGARVAFLYVDVPNALPLLGLASDPIVQLTLSNDEGAALREAATGRRTLRLRLTGRASPDRVYYAMYEHPGGVDADYSARVDRDEMARVDARYHSDRPGLFYNQEWQTFSQHSPASGAWARTFRAPAHWTEYIGPTDDDLTWMRRVTQTTDPLLVGPTQITGNTRYPPGQRRTTEDWFAGPVQPGIPQFEPVTPIAREFCGGCRQGDLFVPPESEVDPDGHYSFLFGGRPGATVQLFQGDTEIPVNRSRGYPRFPMPSEPGEYRLEQRSTQRGVPDVRSLGTSVSSSWTFHSERPEAGQMPDQYLCRVSRFQRDCAFAPLITVRYDLGLDLMNRARAGRAHVFEITAGSPAGTPDRSTVRSMKVWTSTDDGESWHRAWVIRRGGGEFFVIAWHPRLERTNGFVALRVEAADGAGNSLNQTVLRAYALR